MPFLVVSRRIGESLIIGNLKLTFGFAGDSTVFVAVAAQQEWDDVQAPTFNQSDFPIRTRPPVNNV